VCEDTAGTLRAHSVVGTAVRNLISARARPHRHPRRANSNRSQIGLREQSTVRAHTTNEPLSFAALNVPGSTENNIDSWSTSSMIACMVLRVSTVGSRVTELPRALAFASSCAFASLSLPRAHAAPGLPTQQGVGAMSTLGAAARRMGGATGRRQRRVPLEDERLERIRTTVSGRASQQAEAAIWVEGTTGQRTDNRESQGDAERGREGRCSFRGLPSTTTASSLELLI
jgi:hypothetical protein